MLNLYYGRCCCPYSTMWLMLFPLVCWNWVKCETSMAGVIANVADGMATVKSMFIGWCYCQCGRWYSHLMNIVGWQMLLPSVADGITTNCTCNIYGRCYSLGGLDVIATRVVWCVGRCNSQVSITLILVLRCYAEPRPIYVADGICQCSCSGMDYLLLYTELLLLF